MTQKPLIPNAIRCVVFDFYKTLCSEHYFLPLGLPFVDSVAELVFGDNSEKWADPWMRGDLSSADIAEYLSRHSTYTKVEILDGLRQGCANMHFNPEVWRFAQSQKRSGRRTVLATLNMDVFTEVIVPSHTLESMFDVIVNTADIGTLEKDLLWQQAFDALPDGVSFSNSLLIDDSATMVSLFSELGGTAYQYGHDDELRKWAILNGFDASDVISSEGN